MTGFDVLHPLEVHDLTRLVARLQRLQQKTEVVAEVVPCPYLAREPARAVVEDRQAARAAAPRAAFELVDLVSGLAAEELDERDHLRRDEVHGDRVDLLRELERPVGA